MDLIYISSDDDSFPMTMIKSKPRRPITRSMTILNPEQIKFGEKEKTAKIDDGDDIGCHETRPRNGGRWRSCEAAAAKRPAPTGAGGGDHGGKDRPPYGGRQRRPPLQAAAVNRPAPTGAGGGSGRRTRPRAGGRWWRARRTARRTDPTGSGGCDQNGLDPKGGRRRWWRPPTVEKGPAPSGTGGFEENLFHLNPLRHNDGSFMHGPNQEGSHVHLQNEVMEKNMDVDLVACTEPTFSEKVILRTDARTEFSTTAAGGRRTEELGEDTLKGKAPMGETSQDELDDISSTNRGWIPTFMENPSLYETHHHGKLEDLPWSPLVDPNLGFEEAASFYTDWDILSTPYEDLARRAENAITPEGGTTLPTWMEDPSEGWHTSPLPTPTPTEPMEAQPAVPPAAELNGEPASIIRMDMRIQYSRGPIIVNGMESGNVITIRADIDPMTGETQILRI